MGHAMRRAASQRTGGFDPLTVGWTHAYWAEGPEFVALGLADAAAVSTWPDEIGTLDAVQALAAKKPTNRATGGPGSNPTVEFDGGDLVASASSLVQAQPCTMVLIASATTVNPQFFAGAGTPNVALAVITNWYLYAGSGTSTGVAGNTNPHLHRCFFNGASSVHEVDGSATTVNAGTSGFNSAFVLGDSVPTGAAPLTGKIGFAGIFSGDVTTDPKWASFKTWVTSHYGITVA